MGEEQLKTDEGQATGELESTTFEDGVEAPGVEAEPGKTGTGEAGLDDETKTPINQEAVNKRINTITREKYEEKRKREAAEARIAALETDMEKLKTPESVVIPPMPDQFDEDFDQKVAARESAIKESAALKAKKDLAFQTQQQEIQRQQAAGQKEINDLVDGMYSKSEELGIKKSELKEHDDKVALYIQDPQLAKFILGLDDSPLVVKYLAENPVALDKIASMNPLLAASHISTTIVVEAAKLKPGVTKTPDPLNIPGKKGAPPKTSEYLEGVTME